MLIKLVSVLTVTSITTYIGFLISSGLYNREKELKQLITGFMHLEGEVEFLKTPLFEAFLKISEFTEGKVSYFFKTIGEGENQDMKDAFEYAADKADLSLNPKDISVLTEFASSLGCIDKQHQLKTIALLCEELKACRLSAGEDIRKYARLIKSSGLLMGVLICLLLL